MGQKDGIWHRCYLRKNFGGGSISERNWVKVLFEKKVEMNTQLGEEFWGEVWWMSYLE